MTLPEDEVQEIRTLRKGVSQLASRVQGLAEQLSAVNDIQRQQVDTDKRSLSAAEDAARAWSEVQALAESTVSKETLAETEQEKARVAEERRRKRRRRAFATWAIAGLIVGAFVLAFGLLARASARDDARFHAFLVQTRETCQIRNSQGDSQRHTLDRLIATLPPGDKTRIALEASRRQIPPPVDCEANLRRIQDS